MEKERRAEATLTKTRWLLDFARPTLGAIPISEITAPQILAVLRRIEDRGRYETANRLRSVIGSVCRSVIGGATVAPLIAAVPASANDIDPCINACENWLALHAEHKRLANRWCDLEAELERTHKYLSLSRRRQRLLPQAHELEDIDDRLDELHEEMQRSGNFRNTTTD